MFHIKKCVIQNEHQSMWYLSLHTVLRPFITTSQKKKESTNKFNRGLCHESTVMGEIFRNRKKSKLLPLSIYEVSQNFCLFGRFSVETQH